MVATSGVYGEIGVIVRAHYTMELDYRYLYFVKLISRLKLLMSIVKLDKT